MWPRCQREDRCRQPPTATREAEVVQQLVNMLVIAAAKGEPRQRCRMFISSLCPSSASGVGAVAPVIWRSARRPGLQHGKRAKAVGNFLGTAGDEEPRFTGGSNTGVLQPRPGSASASGQTSRLNTLHVNEQRK